ncbi:MAG: hypothetical protein FJ190_08035 [Gammaproteobacteria bacterium]|nr:hypothetical protein [Gammaproteobacteria bacterium]
MITSWFKAGLITVVFIALILYHATNIYFQDELNEDIFSLVKLFQIASTAGGFYLLLGWQKFTKKLFELSGNLFIGGSYEGKSWRLITNANGKTNRAKAKNIIF